MSEFMPHFAPFVVFLFLTTACLIGASFLMLFYGAARRSSFFAKLGAGAAITIATGYLFLVSGVAVASSEEVLPPSSWKNFCEIDCHFAYSLVGAQTTTALGPEMEQLSACGEFVIIHVRPWFDERTISAHRGNGPLTPNRRKIVLIDDRRQVFAPPPEDQATLVCLNDPSTPLTLPLRPGESYTIDIVFDVAKDTRGLRLLITEDDPETRLVIGHANILLHKRIYFGLDSAPSQIVAS